MLCVFFVRNIQTNIMYIYIHYIYGYGSKFFHQGTAGFSPCFHLPEFHVGYQLLTHSNNYIYIYAQYPGHFVLFLPFRAEQTETFISPKIAQWEICLVCFCLFPTIRSFGARKLANSRFPLLLAFFCSQSETGKACQSPQK